MPTYPVISFVVKHQKALALGAAIAVFLLFVAAAVLCQAVLLAVLLAVLGVILGGVAWFLLRLLGEVVQVIAETLLPR